MEAWLEAYHTAAGLPKHAGLLREALVLDLDGKAAADGDGPEGGFTGDLGWLAVLHEGWGGVMPNLDLMYEEIIVDSFWAEFRLNWI